MAILLSGAEVRQLLPMEAAIEIVEAAFRELARGNVLMPPRTVLRLAERRGLQLGMPAYIGGELEALGLKVVTVFGGNPDTHGLPAALGVMLLNDVNTGRGEAVLGAAYLTVVRTGAAGGVAAKYLAAPDATLAGVFGAGVQHLGGGPVLQLWEGKPEQFLGTVAHPNVVALLREAAAQAGISLQVSAAYGGWTTDGAVTHLSGTGVPTGFLSIPRRYADTPNEVLDLQDAASALMTLITLASRTLPAFRPDFLAAEI